MVPASLLDGRAVRIINHWTCGRYKANDTDILHYHFLIEGDGKIIPGVHRVSDNVNTSDGDYAAHTLRCNQFSIGVSLCGMYQCEESPKKAGPYPITAVQWEQMIRFNAFLSTHYAIPCTPQTILQHGEVQDLLRIQQRGKWDVCWLPFKPELSYAQVGNLFRESVQNLLEPKITRKVVVNRFGGRELPPDAVRVDDGDTEVKLRPLCDALMFKIASVETKTGIAMVSLPPPAVYQPVPVEIDGGTAWVKVRDMVEVFGIGVQWIAAEKTVYIK